MTKKYLDELTYKIIGCCINVHSALGPGLLESVYHKCLEEEFRHQKIKFQSELIVPVVYRNLEINAQLRADFYIENCLVVELKAVDGIQPVHEAQLLTYLKLLESPKGILINFNCVNIFRQGQKTFVTEKYRNLDDE
ncbi:MAG: GxxExxY protein [Saprospirales bacterium]|nr:MAG: GxxExxY protein [Saprospirales bacterium]